MCRDLPFAWIAATRRRAMAKLSPLNEVLMSQDAAARSRACDASGVHSEMVRAHMLSVVLQLPEHITQ